jgi:drug/metabolite transporter (DMT)-like permease
VVITEATLERPRVAVAGANAGRGILLCLVSATSFGFAAVFAKESFAAGVTVPTLLSARFGIAALVFWAIVAVRRPRWPSLRVVLICAGLGAIGYALQAACYFTALTKMNASMVAQLLYAYPALVVIIAVALRREALNARKALALTFSAVGLALLLRAGGAAGSMTAVGVVLALGAAVTYALYITVANGLPGDLDVYLLSAIVCTSGVASTGGYSLATGNLHPPTAADGWVWLALVGLVSTAIAAGTFLGGLKLVGASTAAIVSCLEPLVTTLSAVAVYGEPLTLSQVIGGTAVLTAVVALRPATASPVTRTGRTVASAQPGPARTPRRH